MKRVLITLMLLAGLVLGAQASAQELVNLPSAGNDLHDRASLRRGAQLFFQYCAGCHSLKYLRYQRIASDLDLSEDEVMHGLDTIGGSFNGPVLSPMPADAAARFFGKAPPDLSLEVSAKGVDWVYAYLNSFYLDPSSLVGWNNTYLPNAAMPFPLWELQGEQVLDPAHSGAFTLQKAGKQSPQQFRQTTRDLSNFLAYAAEPAALQRHRYGLWVLLFLLLFTGLAWLLKREYWKDVH